MDDKMAKGKTVKSPKSEKETFSGRNVEWKKADGKITYLETNIDKFYKLVKERKRINFYDAAREFRVDKEQIASWARILEDHKLAKVHYPVFGSPVILIEREKPKKEYEEGEKGAEEKPGKNAPKIIIALIGGLLLFFGYVMLVSNPFTITTRSQLTIIIERYKMLFAFLPYPLNIITPVLIIIAALWLVLGMRHRHKTKEAKKYPKDKRSNEIEGKIGKIKKELGS
jgi:membrane protein implicated in regulation of membrane protease activity